MAYTWVRVTSDQVVSKSPGHIGCLIITSDGSGNADATLYDGESVKDPVIMTLKALDNSTQVIRFQPPLKTNRGVYIDIGSNVEQVLVQHSWEHE